jgi:heptaprenyl diphosphate synthase
MAGLPITGFDEDLEDALLTGLAKVEVRLHAAATGGADVLADSSDYLISAGGKRVRPLLALLAAQFGDAEHDEESVLTAATAVELIHLATLYHDDVMDEAPMRRGAVSANERWNNSTAILTGDYLFAQASIMVSYLGTDEARIMAETFGELVKGQMRETVGPKSDEDPIEHYLSVIDQKTGSLISTAGRFGALRSGAAPEIVTALQRFGTVIGTAFQIADDVIDIASLTGDSGKTPGTDLREGVPTLPTLFVQTAPESANPRLLELLSGPIAADADVEEALVLLRESKGLEQAKQYLNDLGDQAKDLLTILPAGTAKTALYMLVDFIIDRVG